MKTKIIRIGNSQGIRIPKEFLKLTNMSEVVVMTVKGNTISIKPETKNNTETYLLSRSALAKDWENADEEEAWAIYNKDQ